MTSSARTRVLLIQPWNFHDENVEVHNHEHSWRNGPYNIILLATILNGAGHEAKILDLSRNLVGHKGNVAACLTDIDTAVSDFRPDIVAVSFFSIHYFETKKIVARARECGERLGHEFLLVAGGIHATVSPESCLNELGFDYAFVGEGDVGLVELAAGKTPITIPGVVNKTTLKLGSVSKGSQIRELDSLPFPDWSLVDHRFYSTPSYARLGFHKTGSLDLVMGRGCVYECSFCAYNALSSVRFYSAEYLVEQMVYMLKTFGVNGFYFTDSTIGNNRKVLRKMCEIILQRGLEKSLVWLANIRPNQINEEQLKLMWRAGCRFLLYGFESNSQRVLDSMQKKCTVKQNEECAALHNKLKFPYNASMILGYPGETEQDILESIDFLRRFQPPSIGVNWYVPLPGSPDYDKLKRDGVIKMDDPEEWRRIGEVNSSRCYASIEEARFKELFDGACRLAYTEIPAAVNESWRQAVAAQLLPGEPGSTPTSVFKNVYSHLPRQHVPT